jgi:tetratricopeptide (TPR) repeat protein
VKRFVVLVAVLLTVGTVSYGVGMARQEAVYQSYIEQGDAALARDDNSVAIEAFTFALAHKADSMAAHLKRGEAYRRGNQLDDALRDLRRAVQLDPLAPHPREILGDVHYAVGRYTSAADRYREYLGLDDRSPRVQYKLALTLLKLGQTAPATAAVRAALAIDDRFAEAHYLLGLCLRDEQRVRESIASLDRAVALNPSLFQAREELADAYGRLGRFTEQNRHLEILAGLDPAGRREAALALGYARDGEADRAVLRLGKAVREYADEPQTYVALGRLWLERAERGGGRIDLGKALTALETAAAPESSSEAQMLYGRALILAGEYARAERVLRQATAVFPVDPLAFFYLADVAERRGRLADARRALVDYAALEGLDSPRFDARLLARLTEAHLRAGDLAAAAQTLARAVQKDPDHPHVRALSLRLR